MRRAEREEQYDLGLQLADLLTEAGRYKEALIVIDEMIGQYPNDVRYPICKSTLVFYFLEDVEEALRCINSTLLLARETGYFRREALGIKARILLKMNRKKQFLQVLEEIMSMPASRDAPDVGRERDFVDRALPGFITPDVRARYNLFRPKRTTDTSVDEPPAWEPPEWE